ncbi:M14 family metallopeptidase [Priestia megaterium]|uniref:M14 family metallopeptidase n=1 Tax=Priestia megaterium TaxID=1404 RepID=UPI002D80799A|nr:M14 family metallopeptidase [Priestia megaterium]MEB4856081.1 M14 family metallopeptidase [Priestia megaterium]
MYRVGNSVEQVSGGSVIKQGDQTPLGFMFRDENGAPVSLTGATVLVKIANEKIVVLEKQATLASDGYTVNFSINQDDITGSGNMRLEFMVTYTNGTKEKFPADDWQRIKITQTLDDLSKTPISYITFEKIKAEFTQMIDDIQEQVDSIIVNAGDSNPEIVASRKDFEGVVHDSLPARIDAADGAIDNFGYWTPPIEPSTAWGTNGIPTTKDPEACINALYEPFRTNHSGYVTRTVLGKDQSGIYNVYCYEFTPKTYSKTLILSAGTHGNEYTSFFALWRFLYHVVNNWRDHPTLTNIRRNVRLIVLPLINPWGFANFKRQNKNGVDLNRNTDYLWDYITGTNFQQGGGNYKGTAPFSEVETQYFKQTVEKYSDAVSSLDFHTITTVQAEHIVYTPRYLNQYKHIFNDVIDWLYKTGNRIVNGTTAVPTLSCWAAYNHNMTVANPEWYNGLYGEDIRDSVEMTEVLKYFGNIIIGACKLQNKTTQLSYSEPFLKELIYDKGTTTTPITLTSTIYGNLSHTLFSLRFRRQGILRAIGKVKVSVSEACTLSINPIIYQVNHPDFGFADIKDAKYYEESRQVSAGTHVFTIFASIPVLPFNYNEATTARPEDAKFRLRAKSTSGTITLEYFRIQLDYTPTDRGKSLERLDFTGLEANDEGSDYVTVFPNTTKYDANLDD